MAKGELWHPRQNLHATLGDIYDAYNQGDPLAEWAVNRMARFMAYGLAGLVYTLDPEVIVLGDEIPCCEKFKGILFKFLADFLPDDLLDGLKIRFSTFVGDSSLVGAGIMLAT
ncbi:MAG: ROK family protein, partial [Elusimicrobiaceae bacterium]|nr:ROK family protein [Elusimicrobiaceae bacterium]